MEIDFLWLGLGIAAFGYFIGDGLKNFKNPSSKNFFDELDEDDGHQLISENDVHYFMGITRADAQQLIEEYPDVPHIKINHTVYYPKEALRKWLLQLNDLNEHHDRNK